MRGTSWAETDPGLIRANNEDALWSDDETGVYVVADGVGGHAAGERASALCVATVRSRAGELRECADAADAAGDGSGDGDEVARRAVFDQMQAVVEEANAAVYSQAHDDESLRGMMTTLSFVVLGRNCAYIAHVGDSRVYLNRDGQLEQITVDHTLAEELVRIGRLTREDLPNFRFKNVIARAIGEKATIQVDLLYLDLRPGDRVLVCSDGLSDFVAETEIIRTLAQHAHDPATALIGVANDHGGGDNITALVVRIEDSSDSETTTIMAVVPMVLAEKVALLGDLFFCQHLLPTERMKVLRYIHEQRVPKGTVVMEQGARGNDFFLLVEGGADVLVGGVCVNRISSGAHFGEIALVSGQPRSATVVTTEETLLFRMSHDGFYDLSQKDQTISVKMLWAFNQSLAQRVTELSLQLVTATQDRAKSR